MISKTDILRMVKNVYRQSQGLPPRRLIHPAREWGIGLFVTAVLLLLVSATSAYVYTTLNTMQETIEPATVTTVRYQRTAVEQALDRYADRERAFAALQANAPQPNPTTATSTAPTSTSSTQIATSTDSSAPATTSAGSPTLSF